MFDLEYRICIIGLTSSIVTDISCNSFYLFLLETFFQSPHNDATWFQEQQAGLHLWPLESDRIHKSYHEVQRY